MKNHPYLFLNPFYSYINNNKNIFLNLIFINRKINTVFLVVIVATCHCRTIHNFKIFEIEHCLFVIVAFNIFRIEILFIFLCIHYLII